MLAADANFRAVIPTFFFPTPDMRYMICIAFSLQALYVDTRLMGPIRSLDGADV